MTAGQLLLLLSVSVGTGITASMGLGGGFILVVYLSLFTEVGQRTAQGINLVFFLPIAVASLFFHAKNKLLDNRVMLPMILGEIPGVAVGVWLSRVLDTSLLRRGFALLVLAVAAHEAISVVRQIHQAKKHPEVTEN